MRIPFLRPKSASATPERARPTAVGDDPAEVQAARTQARRRLVGAVVLLLIGVVGFPVLFDTQPRPLPIDTPIEVPRRDAVASGLVGKESAVTPSQPLPALPADAGTEEAPASASATASAPAPPAPALVKASAPTPKPAPPPAAKPAVPAPAATVAPPEKPAAAASAPAESGRYVIQAGAYSEAGKLREARAKIEKLGLKTYTQVVESDKGSRTRVRVGPYATRAEAEAVAAQVKRSGLPAAILAL